MPIAVKCVVGLAQPQSIGLLLFGTRQLKCQPDDESTKAGVWLVIACCSLPLCSSLCSSCRRVSSACSISYLSNICPLLSRYVFTLCNDGDCTILPFSSGTSQRPYRRHQQANDRLGARRPASSSLRCARQGVQAKRPNTPAVTIWSNQSIGCFSLLGARSLARSLPEPSLMTHFLRKKAHQRQMSRKNGTISNSTDRRSFA